MPTRRAASDPRAGAIILGGGTVFYRINRDWFAIGTLFVSRQTLTHNDVDPATPMTVVPGTGSSVTGLTGFARLAYRF